MCLEDVVHDRDEQDVITGNARLNGPFYLATGRPNIVPPYTKRIYIKTIGGTQEVEHEAIIFIEGLYSKGKGDSFALPSHEPIMILRDPPGGTSSATYENVKTTIRAIDSETATHIGVDFTTKATVDVEQRADICAGGGFGAMVLACKNVADAEVEGGLEVASEIG